MNIYHRFVLSCASCLCCIVSLTMTSGCIPKGPGLFTQSPGPLTSFGVPDPSVLKYEGFWYCYSSSGCLPGGSYPVHRSKDLMTWDWAGFIFPSEQRPAWVGACDYWAPEVHLVGDRYVAFYSARNKDQRFCIGAAISPTPIGPFVDLGSPIQTTPHVGLIDANYFYDEESNRHYLLWKEDGNDQQGPTPIRLRELDPKSLLPFGETHTLIANNQLWEGALVEAPFLIRHRNWYYLFYSANAFNDDSYATGVARSRSLVGPYVKNPGGPLLSSTDTESGPGHPFLTLSEKGDWIIFYHARAKGSDSDARRLFARNVGWNKKGWPVVMEVPEEE